MVYYCIIFFALLSFISLSGEKTEINESFAINSYAFTLFGIVLFALLSGINADKADHLNYLDCYKNSPLLFDGELFDFIFSQHTEPGYNLFQAFVKTLINVSSIWFIFFCFLGILIRYKFYVSFIDYSDLILVFFSFLSHEYFRKDSVQIRNGFASALVLYALIFLFSGHKKKFYFTVVIAMTFHMMAIVALPLGIFCKKRTAQHDKILRNFFLFSLVMTFFFPIKKILITLAELGVVPTQITVYLSWPVYTVSMSLTNPFLIKQVIIVLFILFNKKKYFKDEKVYFLFQVYLLSTVYYLVFRDFEILAARFGSLFYGVESSLLVLMINGTKKNVYIKKIGLLLFYFVFAVYNCITFTKFLGWNPVFVE